MPRLLLLILTNCYQTHSELQSYNCRCAGLWLLLSTTVTGEKLWLDQCSNPGPWSYHQQLFTLPGYILPGHGFRPWISYFLPRRTYRLNHLTTVGYLCWEPFVTGEKTVARPGLKSRTFRWPCEHSTTELPSHPAISPTNFPLNRTPISLLSIHSSCNIIYVK